MLEYRSATDAESYILFLSDTIISEDIAEEIGLNRPHANIRQVSTLAEFMDAIARERCIRACFLELHLLGPYWDAAHDRLRNARAQIVLCGDEVDNLAARGETIAGARFLPRPYGLRELAALINEMPDACASG